MPIQAFMKRNTSIHEKVHLAFVSISLAIEIHMTQEQSTAWGPESTPSINGVIAVMNSQVQQNARQCLQHGVCSSAHKPFCMTAVLS